MPLRNALISQIHEALDASTFTSADFEVSTSGAVLLTVTFRAKREYAFIVKEDTNYDGSTQVFARRTPGAELDTDDTTVNNLSELPRMVGKWTGFLRAELRAALPVYDELDALRQRVEDHIRDHVSEPNEQFSREEADELSKKEIWSRVVYEQLDGRRRQAASFC